MDDEDISGLGAIHEDGAADGVGHGWVAVEARAVGGNGLVLFCFKVTSASVPSFDLEGLAGIDV